MKSKNLEENVVIKISESNLDTNENDDLSSYRKDLLTQRNQNSGINIDDKEDHKNQTSARKKRKGWFSKGRNDNKKMNKT